MMDIKSVGNQTTSSESPVQQTSSILSIASSAVTSAFSIDENINDALYLQSTPIDTYLSTQQNRPDPNRSHLDTGNRMITDEPSNRIKKSDLEIKDLCSQDEKITTYKMQPNTESTGEDQASSNESDLNFGGSSAPQQTKKNSIDEHQAKKRRNKIIKKGAKLDAKSKLEKSRQSARECRARKKLRYQYLEDLVCNREKAVVKLREELSVFCDYSRQIDAGALSSADRHMLIEQTKENNKT